jgi:hypothetical protein
MERQMQTPLPEYEIYAIRYATRAALRRDNFIGGDSHDGPMPMDGYAWVALGRNGAFVIDTGFTAEMARARKRSYLRCPVDSLALLGLEAGAIGDVVFTHIRQLLGPRASARRQRGAARRRTDRARPELRPLARGLRAL